VGTVPLTDIADILRVIILVIIAPRMPILMLKLRQWVDSRLLDCQISRGEREQRPALYPAQPSPA
jgi:hypothetical protein